MSQLTVFDYSNYSEEQIRKSIENKALMQTTGKMVSEGLFALANYAKSQHDNLGSYPAFIDWCQKELGYSESVANRFLRVGKSQVETLDSDINLPNSLSGLDAIASALLKAENEGEKQEIIKSLKSKTTTKGKALTEKEIKEITKEYEAKINQLQTDLKEAKQGELFFQNKLDEKITETNQLKETIDNQNKQIKELNSDISSKELALKSLESQRSDLDLLQQELDAKIAKEANIIIQETLEKERLLLSQKEADLIVKQQEIENQLATAQQLKEKTTLENQKRVEIDSWMLAFSDLNNHLREEANYLKSYPDIFRTSFDFTGFSEEEYQILSEKIDRHQQDFYKLIEEHGKHLNNLSKAIMRLTFKRVESTIEVSAIKGK